MYFWEQVAVEGLVACPALVVSVHKGPDGQKNGHLRLHVYYTDGADGPKPDAEWSETPMMNRWTWPMQANGQPNA